MRHEWQNFYNTIRESNWPDCEHVSAFTNLPENIKKEVIHDFNGLQYLLGSEHSNHPRVEIVSIDSKYKFLMPRNCKDLIRIGNVFDGGYVIPKQMITTADGLLSGGIGLDWRFEQHWSELNSSVIHAYDATLTRADYQSDRYDQMWTGNRLMYEQFLAPDKVSLSNAIENMSVNNIFVKLDIEGGEYKCIDDIIKHKDNIIGMVIEFHEIEKIEQFVESIQLLQQHYDIVHIHANNHLNPPEVIGELPYVLEITLSRKDFITDTSFRYNTYLIGIDSPNDCTKCDWFMYFN